MARNKYRLCPDWKYRTYFDWIWNVELSKTLIIVDYRLGFLHRGLQGLIIAFIVAYMYSGTAYLKAHSADVAAVHVSMSAGTFDATATSTPAYCGACRRASHFGMVFDRTREGAAFVATRLEHERVNGTRETFYAVGAEELSLSLQASFRVAASESFVGELGTGAAADLRTPVARLFATGTQLASAKASDALATWPAGAALNFSVARLLELTGVTLDDAVDGTTRRATGTTLLVRLRLHQTITLFTTGQTYADIAVERVDLDTSRGWRAAGAGWGTGGKEAARPAIVIHGER